MVPVRKVLQLSMLMTFGIFLSVCCNCGTAENKLGFGEIHYQWLWRGLASVSANQIRSPPFPVPQHHATEHTGGQKSLEGLCHKSFSWEKTDVLVQKEQKHNNSTSSSVSLGADSTFGYRVALVSEDPRPGVENGAVILEVSVKGDEMHHH